MHASAKKMESIAKIGAKISFFWPSPPFFLLKTERKAHAIKSGCEEEGNNTTSIMKE